MSTTATANASAAETETKALDQKFEVTKIPVADVDRAKAFYVGLGWRMDIDFEPAPGIRAVQMTPPGSPASIQFGTGPSNMQPGTLDGMILVVEDIVKAREDLVSRGAAVTPIWHAEPGKGQVEGLDPGRTSYANRASFPDPDGNTWQLQEVTERLPGRVESDVPALAALLYETSIHHGAFEAVASPHNWWDWYAAYASARQTGSTEAEAEKSADAYMVTLGVTPNR
jgi:catechol 2,3-dioxygenase-like lactoylglutathione lyase family enzyme